MGFDHRFSDSSPSSAPPSLIQRLCSSIRSSCCCIGGCGGEDERPASLMSSSAIWFRCQNLVYRVTAHQHHRARRSSGDFSYDPFSYALNFDDGHNDDDLPGGRDDFRHRSFSSRLPPSPPRSDAPPRAWPIQAPPLFSP
ncbi:hypothetical protein OPV22_018744 [Ensete ventricosum]|uniref:Uncharacterized protein n=1 Tax=Ensete ventricosum TaxID=4639 RepID=A0AAV8R0W0_ENSVE|nr:hypothetical protein OPV22_018744 [Ensete ventricosum]RWV83790.1 hypothetical protein GW17_00054561 [Ensete ventricosum]RWW56093.1 hypothetical protein BHE74_00037217 [Ensete ventricosum]RZS28769.1 hypothetical protein BHM03_00062410 [Ensete ventricosum]